MRCDVVLLPGTASYLHACSQHRSSCGNTCFSAPILIRSTTTTNFPKRCREMMDISDSVNIDVVTANEQACDTIGRTIFERFLEADIISDHLSDEWSLSSDFSTHASLQRCTRIQLMSKAMFSSLRSSSECGILI